jgi:putative DNA primase/helicase
MKKHAVYALRKPTIEFKAPWTSESVTPGGRPMALSDLGNAERFAIANGSDVRHVQAIGRWLVWDGKRFSPDTSGEIKRRAKTTMRGILFEASVQDNEQQRKQLIAHQIRSESNRAIRDALSLAESDERIAVRLEDFDCNPLLFNVLNGTIDLKASVLLAHSREDGLTKLAPVEFDPRARCPQWDRFLSEIMPDPELVRFVQRAVGYSLTGDASEQCVFLLYGTGANGKSKFLEVIRHIFGDYGSATHAGTFLVAKGAAIRNDLARLRGARFVTTVEPEADRWLDESLIKVCSGEDTISVRFLYGEYFEFEPVFKLWLATNDKPRIVGRSEAIWRRIRLIPFSVTVPVERRDRKLAEKLKSEASGILNWALAGLRDWQVHGLGDAAAVRNATGEYRSDSDVVGRFLDAGVSLDPRAEARASEIYASYRAWAADLGEHVINERDFSSALADRGFSKRRIGARAGKPAGVYWLGVCVVVRAV